MLPVLPILRRRKIFLLGVGAQKAGTSWVHSQLRQSRHFDGGFCKEYHVFDAIFSPHCQEFRQLRLDELSEKLRNKQLACNALARPDLLRHLSFLDSIDCYFDYFDYLWRRSPLTVAVGEITPSYSILDRDAFGVIKSGLESRGFEVKVLFLLRDPVERIWSMFRMLKRNQSRLGLWDPCSSLLNMTALSYKLPEVELRTRYDRTITELEAVFKRENIFYGFYETLFSASEFSRLTSFLKLGSMVPAFDKLVNASPDPDALPMDLGKEIAMYYADVYSFLFEKFGEDLRGIMVNASYL